MDGSITQLGLSNYLINSGDNAVSFFRHVYKNHTNFVKDTRELYFKNGIKFGQTSSFRFDEDGKYGDLITNIVIAIDLPDISNYTNINGQHFGYCNSIGNVIAENIILRINGNIIDQHNSEWLNIAGELMVKPGCKNNYYTMIQQYDDNVFSSLNFQGGRIYIPLQFWFCRNITNKNSSLVFPLCGLYNSSIELSINLRNFQNLITTEDKILTGYPNVQIENGSLIVDYVILDEVERKLYLNTPKQLNVINQLQTYKFNVSSDTLEHTFSLKSMHYLVTELIFVYRSNDWLDSNTYFNYNNSSILSRKQNPIKSVRLIFDGRERIKTTNATQFCILEPTKVHTNTPVNKFIHVYSFALEPEKIEQPTGVMNFSEIQEPLLHISFNSPLRHGILFVFAVNYNVLICSNGAGWLLHHLSKSIPSVLQNNDCIFVPPLPTSTNLTP